MKINFSKSIKNKKPRNIGDIRKSQLITTYGVGNIVDFVDNTVIISGVDDWEKEPSFIDRRIANENLQALVKKDYFVEPKTSGSNKYSNDIKSFIFPQKLYCPSCNSILDVKKLNKPTNPRCIEKKDNDKTCNGRLVPSRLIIICENGHIDDFPYSWWVHNGEKCSSGIEQPEILMYNVGGRNDTDSIWLECKSCKKRKKLIGAFDKNAFAKYNCRGKHPHLGNDYYEECNSIPVSRLLATNTIYYAVTLKALLIPPWSKKAYDVICKRFDELKHMSVDGIKEYIKEQQMFHIDNVSIEEFINIYNNIVDQKNDRNKFGYSEVSILHDEYNILCKGDIETEYYKAGFVDIPQKFQRYFSSITAIDKLTVTEALVGFTRLMPPTSIDDKRIVKLSKEQKNWLPGVELKGEGIFFRFNDKEIEFWLERIGTRYEEMKKAFESSNINFNMFSEKYILLHTFSHLFIRQVANECGYNSASLSEKIYSNVNDEEMSGVLIYLSSSDSDGSLGGLVNVANDIELLNKVLSNMLIEATWCSSDPVCSNSKMQGVNSLNYAACHACTLLPETSCEFRNLLLDRVAIVGKNDDKELGYFKEILSDIM